MKRFGSIILAFLVAALSLATVSIAGLAMRCAFTGNPVSAILLAGLAYTLFVFLLRPTATALRINTQRYMISKRHGTVSIKGN